MYELKLLDSWAGICNHAWLCFVCQNGMGVWGFEKWGLKHVYFIFPTLKTRFNPTNCICVERDALLELCSSNSGWCSSNGWSSGGDYCQNSWKQVTCHSGGGASAGRVKRM